MYKVNYLWIGSHRCLSILLILYILSKSFLLAEFFFLKTHTINYLNTFIEVAEDCPIEGDALQTGLNYRRLFSIQTLFSTPAYWP